MLPALFFFICLRRKGVLGVVSPLAPWLLRIRLPAFVHLFFLQFGVHAVTFGQDLALLLQLYNLHGRLHIIFLCHNSFFFVLSLHYSRPLLRGSKPPCFT